MSLQIPPEKQDRKAMVGWYNPGQLCRTAVEVLISTIFGRHADFRLIEALSTPELKPEPFDWVKQSNGSRDDVWIDYVSDAGDGWNSTYTVAYSLAQAQLSTKGTTTPRGDLLIFGGDEVYPTASKQSYRQRLVAAYETALQESADPAPWAFAIPGNHDWYDSLVSFTRLFCNRRTFAAWKTWQTRSYFALKLPHRWWLLGTDVQLDSDVDAPQVDYFLKIRQQMEDGDNVILCTAEPHWVEAAMYGAGDKAINESNLGFLENTILKGVNVRVFLAGDLHHYRRHTNARGIHKITAGGGGAFLHPTHAPKTTNIDGFEEKAAYPTRKECRDLCFHNLFFLFKNPWFGLLAGPVYVLLASSFGLARLSREQLFQWPSALEGAIENLFNQPIWVLAVFTGFVLFTDTHKKWYRAIAGPIHALTHLAAAFVLSTLVTRLIGQAGYDPHGIGGQSFHILLIFAFGWVVGSFLMGIYLLISLNVFGRHSNEAFSSLGICDYKDFLRLHIDKHGVLTIYPYKIHRVPRNWKKPSGELDKTRPQLVPADDAWTEPELIEAPIEMP